MWPQDAEGLREAQEQLARARPEPWVPDAGGLRIGTCWVCAPRGLTGPGEAGDTMWAAAGVILDGQVVDQVVRHVAAGAPYEPGRFAFRLGPALESAIAALDIPADVLMVGATGRDLPRRAGFALHLGASLDVPTVGVTHRPLVAEGSGPATSVGTPGTCGSGARWSPAGCVPGRRSGRSSSTPAGGWTCSRRSSW